MLYFHDWPDVTIHTSKDQPENLDATKLGRVIYLGAGIAYTLAALPEAEAPKLVSLARASAETDLAQARLRAALAEDPRDGSLAVRESLAEAESPLASIGRRWPETAKAVSDLGARLKEESVNVPTAVSGDARVPVRDAGVRGPLSVYYYDYFTEALAAKGVKESALPPVPQIDGDAELMQYEALNLADGRRSVSDIRDILTGRYSVVPLKFVAVHFERLAAAGIVGWK